MKNILRWFYHLTTIISFLGTILILSKGEGNIYTIWLMSALVVGSYLIEDLW